MFTLAISYLTTSNLPWFVDLTFQVPMQYCSLQHWTLLLSPFTSTTGYCFCFGSIPSFFLELFFHWSPMAYWAPTHLGSSSFSILSFCLFILFMGFSRQEYWSGLLFPSPVGGEDGKLWYGISSYHLIKLIYSIQYFWFNVFQICRSVLFDSLWPHGLQHARPPCPSPSPRVHSNSHPSSRWCHPTISSSVVPFSSCS